MDPRNHPFALRMGDGPLGFTWSDPVPILVNWNAMCRCGHDAGWHTISITGRLGRCRGLRWLVRKCQCKEFTQ